MLRRALALWFPDPAEGSGAPPVEKPDPAPAVPPNAPPAAAAVVTGKTERELQLEKDLQEAQAGRKKAETDASYLADENRRLKESGQAPKQRRGGWVFPDEEEE